MFGNLKLDRFIRSNMFWITSNAFVSCKCRLCAIASVKYPSLHLFNVVESTIICANKFSIKSICSEWSTEMKSFTRHIRRKVPVQPVAQRGNRIKFRGHIWMEWFECRIRLMPFCCFFSLSFNDLLAIDELTHRPWMCGDSCERSITQLYSLQLKFGFFFVFVVIFFDCRPKFQCGH